ncbi:uncharacterized protein [Cardiocondyla obscurior]|uniref:uncharacterized protein n=1 Tax=Cardiocondyla obscurior TaxID=286306 RepID=UPI0039657CF7
MAEVRAKINLSEVGISEKVTMRTTATGALLIQVSGSENDCKADALAGQMKQVLANREDVKISRPTISAEIRVWPLEPSITKDEVIEAVTSKGLCQPRDMRQIAGSMNSLWLRLPLTAAKKASEGGKLAIGWTRVKVALLDPRPMRCFKCLERGHTRERCPNKVDRSGKCYRCGNTGHVARVCTATPRCPICADIGRRADHILGGKQCTTRNRRGSPPSGGNKLRTSEETAMEVDIPPPADALPQRRRPLEEGRQPAGDLEPHRIPENHPSWIEDETKTVALTWRWWQGAPPCAPIGRGRHFAAVHWGPFAVVGTYLPPSGSSTEYEEWLEEIGVCIGGLRPLPVVLAGDFNAWSTAWGSRLTNKRGKILEEWAASWDLVLLNKGKVSTCIRAQGESVIDLTWASPAAANLVRQWRVATELEHLSDHRYISVKFGLQATPARNRRRPSESRWASKKIREDVFRASLEVSCWSRESQNTRSVTSVQSEADWFMEEITNACNASMPKVRHIYKAARKDLRTAIRKAKTEAWESLLQDLDDDPWGLAYKIVTKKLRTPAPSVTETLDPTLIREVVNSLFPDAPRGPRPEDFTTGRFISQREEIPSLEEEEFGVAVRRSLKGNTAPGPDGIQKKILSLALPLIGDKLKHLLDRCLKEQAFPQQWKCARLVLLKKKGKEDNAPSSFRPICLLDEAGKLLERVIANRLVQHLKEVGPNLSASQYGFREGLSTVDAILRLRSLSEEITSQGGVAMGILIDISNAFNSLPGRQYGGPPAAQDSNIFTSRRPLLWNLGYNAVLHVALPPGCHTLCYADDTIVLAGGDNWQEARARAQVATQAVLTAIRKLGLEVAMNKTEALWFYNKAQGPPPYNKVFLDSAEVIVTPTVKYLGLLIDGQWAFREHITTIAAKAASSATALRGILPNLGGPSGAARQLYANTVRSIVMYGAPVWANDLALSRSGRTALEKAFHLVNVRSASIPHRVRAAAAVLAGVPPLDLTATEHSRVYEGLRKFERKHGVRPTPIIKNRSQRERTQEPARGGAVPALPSSSNDGPPTTCSAGVVEEYASAQDYDKPGPASFKQKKARPKGHSPYPSPLVNRRPSRASSPTPSMASNTTADVYTDDVFISGTEDSDVSGSFGSGKRKRGRPATTGDYVGLAAAKRQVLETEQEIAEMEERKAILDPLSSLNPKLRESVDDAVEHYLEEFKNAPSGDIVSQTYEDVDQILRELDQARKEIKNLREEVRALRCRAAELPIIRPACTSPNATEKRLRTPPPMDEPMEEDNPLTNTTIGRSKVLRDTSPSEFEAEELLLKRLDGLFGKWCERRFGTSPPFPIAKEKPPASTTQKKQKPTAGSTKKAAESSTKERRKKKTGATSGQESQSEISMPPPS